MEDLGTLPGGDFSRALAINEPGDIVGTSGSPLGARATLWPGSGGIQDLNALIPAGNDFVLTHAVNINNPGTILAIGHDDLGRDRTCHSRAANSCFSLSTWTLKPPMRMHWLIGALT